MLALGRTSRLHAGTDVLVLPYRKRFADQVMERYSKPMRSLLKGCTP
jgi:hypothetical protein